MKNKIKQLAILLLIISFVSCAAGKKNFSGKRVGFDIDDTLLFSTPAFTQAAKLHKFGIDEFWAAVNSLDPELSIIKKKTFEIVKQHISAGDEIFVITARPPKNIEPSVKFIARSFNIPESNIYFEPKTKIDKIKELKLNIFYGDSDTDISDAQSAGCKAVRILRSPKSSYRDEKTGELKNYKPGLFNEEIIKDSEE